MSTKSMLKDVTIKGKKNCQSFVKALEIASNKKSKVVVAPKPHVANIDELDQIFAK